MYIAMANLIYSVIVPDNKQDTDKNNSIAF